MLPLTTLEDLQLNVHADCDWAGVSDDCSGLRKSMFADHLLDIRMGNCHCVDEVTFIVVDR